MNLTAGTDIQVFNYTPSPVIVKGRLRTYVVEGASAYGPGIEFMDGNDVIFANGKSPVFKTGLLEFKPEEEEEIFAALHATGWRKTVIREKEIDDMLLNPTAEKMQKIIDAADLPTLERFRGHMIALVNSKADISSRVVKLVNDRFSEFTLHPGMRSKMQAVAVEPKTESKEVEALKKELNDMKAAISSIAAANVSTTEAAPSTPKTTAKKRTSPSKKKTS